MMGNYISISFVSGKGGVGKTTLATNVAWLMHGNNNRVMIIDLDFQNLGATGLFSGLFELPKTNAFDLLHSDVPTEKPDVFQVEDDLYFLPGAFMHNVDSTEKTLTGVFDKSDNIRKNLINMLDKLYEWYDIDCFIIDCHGGIDSTSIAAAGICDSTVMVTEADSVTFSGTLALLDSYMEHYANTDIKPHVEFIVNRIPDKYRWRDLDRMYQKFLKNHLGRFTPMHCILSYIPAENILADSFGDYPFQAQLAKGSVFNKKLMLVIRELLSKHNGKLISHEINNMFASKRKIQKVYKIVSSAETRGMKRIYTSFALSTLVALIMIPYFIKRELVDRNKWIDSEEAENELPRTMIDTAHTIGDWLIVALAAVTVFYIFRSAWNVCGYYFTQMRFKSALFQLLPRKQAASMMEIWRLRVFFFSSFAGALIMTLYFFLMVFAFISIVAKDGL